MQIHSDLPADLRKLQEELEEYARDFGLSFPKVIFEFLDWDMLNQIASYDGFPVRYPHWRFGMEYERLCKSYAYGLHRIYEMVINTDPCYAYLLASNKRVDQKLVMLHVFGHADFFKNNMWFAKTNRKMLDEMANHASRVRRYIDRYGLGKVEKFLDDCLSIELLIDIHSVGIKRHDTDHEKLDDEEPKSLEYARIPAKSYMDDYINPPEYLDAQRRKFEKERKEARKIPRRPERDVMNFILQYGDLRNWQRDILGIVREESYYFAPLRQTKIMNEGWASYCHSRLMTEKALTPDEVIDYADHHSGTMAIAHGKVNPYKIGIELFKDIEDRWNRGAFGKEWEECDDLKAREDWDNQVGKGAEKVFEVRRVHNDIGFIENYLTRDFVNKMRMYTWDYNKKGKYYYISSREYEKIKRRLLTQLTNFGRPIIEVVDGNYQKQGQLYLIHRHYTRDLDPEYTRRTLPALFRLWGRPVLLETIEEENKRHLYICRSDGSLDSKRLEDDE